MTGESSADSFPLMTESDPVSGPQRRAALAYASALLEVEPARAAAEDALNAFRQALRRQPAEGAPADAVLLALTRLMTAVSLPDRSSPEDRRRAVLASMDAQSHCTCREAGVLLAARANGNIEPREVTALDEHLSSCPDCRMLQADAAVAEHAFRNAVNPPRSGGIGLPGGTARVLGAGGALAIVIVAVVIVLSGGSHHPRAPGTLANATPPVTTATHPTAATTIVHQPATHHTAIVHHATATHTATVAATPVNTATSPATPPVTHTTVAVAAQTPAPAATPRAAPVADPAPTTAADTAVNTPATASSSAGSSSALGAETAPQQGIGTISSGR